MTTCPSIAHCSPPTPTPFTFDKHFRFLHSGHVNFWTVVRSNIPKKVCPLCLVSGVQWRVLDTFHNRMAFRICTVDKWIYTMDMWILPNGHVDFEQWLGQVNPRRHVHLSIVVRGLKKRQEKAIWKPLCIKWCHVYKIILSSDKKDINRHNSLMDHSHLMLSQS
jgi:hypothetical protein